MGGKSGRSRPFRLAVIGAGIHAETNIYPSLANHVLADVETVAVCDLDQTPKARRMAARCGAGRTYTDYRAMIGTERPDGVIVCLNGRLHPPVVVDCLELGTAVLVEKPPALSVEEAARMAEASNTAGRPVMIGHQKRHGTAYETARELTRDRRRFGRIVQIEAKMHGMPRFPTNFSCLLEWQMHGIDLVRSFGGDIREVVVRSWVLGKNRAAVVLLLTFESGAVGAVGWGTFGGPGPYCERIEVVGDRGRGVIVENATRVIGYDGSWGRSWSPDWNPNLANQSQLLMGYVGEIRHFVDCVRRGATPVPSIEDGVKNLQALAEVARQMEVPAEWRFTPSRF